MNKKKIFNDPVYGFIWFDDDLLYQIIDHPYFQKLRRISQMGLACYVYPGATHTRFHHALGALHLMTRAITTLQQKGVEISDQEKLATYTAILLHDIGHGPFSHALERQFIDVHHEKISLAYMHYFNTIFEGKLDMAIEIFKNEYKKPFLHQLVSGQLDMDRMDYLNRDSYYSGVAEGVIGYDRIISMLNVADNKLVVEEKGIYSIEKFIISRRIMYWQVYLHKTSVAIDSMLRLFMAEIKERGISEYPDLIPVVIRYFLEPISDEKLGSQNIKYFSELDDVDVLHLLKVFAKIDDPILGFLARSIIERNIFNIFISKEPISSDFKDEIRLKVANRFNITSVMAGKMIFENSESNLAYSDQSNEIIIQMKSGTLNSLSEVMDYPMDSNVIVKYFLCFPRF